MRACLLLVACGCAQGTAARDRADATPRADAAGPRADAAPGAPDAAEPAPDAAPPPPAGPARLALSEVVLAPQGAEFVEVVNPTAAAVFLGHYYVADAPAYFRVPAGALTPDSSDFVVRLPPVMLAAGGVATLAIGPAAAFTSAYGAAPTFAFDDGEVTIVASTATPTLTNDGELVALFYWDGASDLVTDVDLVLAGEPIASNALQAKAGLAIDGPDVGGITSGYVAEARTLPIQLDVPGAGESTKRVLLEAGHEAQGGASNGVLGDDETSEATRTTWDTAFTAPTPGTTALPLP